MKKSATYGIFRLRYSCSAPPALPSNANIQRHDCVKSCDKMHLKVSNALHAGCDSRQPEDIGKKCEFANYEKNKAKPKVNCKPKNTYKNKVATMKMCLQAALKFFRTSALATLFACLVSAFFFQVKHQFYIPDKVVQRKILAKVSIILVA